MAARRTFARIQAVFGLLGVLALVITYSIVTGWNPLPGWGNWISNVSAGPLSKPATTWVKRVGNAPQSAAVVGNYVIISTRGSVEAHSLYNGERLWTYDAAWAVTAGSDRPVVVVGRPIKKGFDVYDVTTGLRLWGRTENLGVWAYSDGVLLLHCSGGSCVLSAVGTSDGAELWHRKLAGTGQPLTGAGHGLAMLDPIDSSYQTSLAATPSAAPHLIGLTMADRMHVVDTGNGAELTSFPISARARSVVAGDVVITTSSDFRNGKCYYTLAGFDPKSGRQLWSDANIDTKTSGGLNCDERRDPVGGGGAVYAVNDSGRDTLISATSGDTLYTAPKGGEIVATDGAVAVIRSADKKTVFGVTLGSGSTRWSHEAAATTLVGLAPGAVLLADPATEHLVAIDPHNAYAFFDVKSGATVLGLGPHDVIINIGRSFGPLPMSTGP